MQILRSEVNIEHLLCEVVATGGAFVPQAFTDEYLSYLSEELNALEYQRYQSAADANVYEKHGTFRARIYQPPAPIPRLVVLAEYIGWQIRSAQLARCNNHLFYPDDVNVWRYDDSSCGIGAHRDYTHDEYLIVGITVSGYSLLEFFGECKTNPKPKRWESGPGSLMLLRGPGLCPNDSRPYHAVHPPKHGERVSIIIRQDVRNSDERVTDKEY